MVIAAVTTPAHLVASETVSRGLHNSWSLTKLKVDGAVVDIASRRELGALRSGGGVRAGKQETDTVPVRVRRDLALIHCGGQPGDQDSVYRSSAGLIWLCGSRLLDSRVQS